MRGFEEEGGMGWGEEDGRAKVEDVRGLEEEGWMGWGEVEVRA